MTEAEQQMVSEIRNCSELESPSPEAAKSLLMIVTTKPDEGFTTFSEMVRKYNQEPPFGFSEPDIFKTFVRVREYFLKIESALSTTRTYIRSSLSRRSICYLLLLESIRHDDK